MLCRRCEAFSQGRARGTDAQSRVVWGADQIRGVECALCGEILDVDDIERLLAEKHSQLAQFGLAGPEHLPPPSASPDSP